MLILKKVGMLNTRKSIGTCNFSFKEDFIDLIIHILYTNIGINKIAYFKDSMANEQIGS